jgi:hypothetical protein
VARYVFAISTTQSGMIPIFNKNLVSLFISPVFDSSESTPYRNSHYYGFMHYNIKGISLYVPNKNHGFFNKCLEMDLQFYHSICPVSECWFTDQPSFCQFPQLNVCPPYENLSAILCPQYNSDELRPKNTVVKLVISQSSGRPIKLNSKYLN